MSARDQMIAAIVTVLAVFGAAWGAYGLLRRCRRLASLMDAGDGQGGVPPLRRTRPMWIDPTGNGNWLDEDGAFHSTGCPATRPLDPDPALGCRFCGFPYDATADCGCASPCGDPNCGALAWQAVANTEELKP